MSGYILVDELITDRDEYAKFISMVDKKLTEGWRLQGGISVVRVDIGEEHYSQAMYKEPSPRGQTLWRDTHTGTTYENAEPLNDEMMTATNMNGDEFTIPNNQLERIEEDE